MWRKKMILLKIYIYWKITLLLIFKNVAKATKNTIKNENK